MTTYLGTVDHGARCFRCLRPDHVDVYDEHVARVDFDALAARLADTQAGAGLLSRQSKAYEARLAEREAQIKRWQDSSGCVGTFCKADILLDRNRELAARLQEPTNVRAAAEALL